MSAPASGAVVELHAIARQHEPDAAARERDLEVAEALVHGLAVDAGEARDLAPRDSGFSATNRSASSCASVSSPAEASGSASSAAADSASSTAARTRAVGDPRERHAVDPVGLTHRRALDPGLGHAKDSSDSSSGASSSIAR